MAKGGIDFEAAAPESTAQPAQPSNPAGGTTTEKMHTGKTVYTGAYSPTELLSKLGSSASLSTEGSEYLKRLVAELQERISAIRGENIQNKIEAIPVACDACCIYRLSFMKGKVNVLMAFSETYMPPADQPFLPPAHYLGQMTKEFTDADILIDTTVVVTKKSYERLGRMVNFLTSVFLVTEYPEHFALCSNNLQKDNYIVSTNVENVRRLFKEHYPVETMPPCDIGLAIYTNPKERNKDKKLLCLVAGTTTFRPDTSSATPFLPGGSKFVPITRITAIWTPTPSVSMGIWAITMAADYWKRRGAWITQFTNFTKDAKYNIGNLVRDESTDSPARIENLAQLEQFVLTRLHNPGYLTLEIADGAPRIPGIEKIIVNQVNRELAYFFGTEEELIDNNIAASYYVQYTGIFGSEEDTREASYLTLVADDPKQANTYKALLSWSDQPDYTLKALERIFGHGMDIRPNYIVTSVFLNSQFIIKLANTLAPVLNVMWDADNNFINTAVGLPEASVADFGTGSIYHNNINGGAGFGGPNIYGM